MQLVAGFFFCYLGIQKWFNLQCSGKSLNLVLYSVSDISSYSLHHEYCDSIDPYPVAPMSAAFREEQS